MEKVIIDLEADGLLDTVTKIHCLSYAVEGKRGVHTLVHYSDIADFFRTPNRRYIGHNIIEYDIPVVEKVLGITLDVDCIDTLPLSWYLHPERKSHGLESWGEYYGVPKPVITDWENQTLAQYQNRCEEDVKINRLLWEDAYKYLKSLYDYNEEALDRFLYYVEFKLKCAREMAQTGLLLNADLCREMVEQLGKEKQEKLRELKAVMPPVPVYKKKTYPKAIVRKDGTLSMQGELWFDLAKAEGVSPDTQEIKVVKSYKAPNPGSHDQIKKWLYSLGWVPEHIKHVRNKKTGETKEIPQIASKDGGGEICASIKKLYEKEPQLKVLNGLSVLTHRIAIFEGFLKDVKEDGKIYAGISGLTNTLRFQHRTLVNLPGEHKPYGKQIRGALQCEADHTLCGSDLSGIEDNTKRHYIFKYDPDYVREMMVPGYDAHLELGILAGFLVQEDADFYKDVEKRRDAKEVVSAEELSKYKVIKTLRHKSKTTNFSCTYKVGAESLARNAGMPLKEAVKLRDVYWQRNKAILQVENSLYVKELGTQLWLLNPVSGFYYSLRNQKDRFSTLNQGTAVYVFDAWVRHMRELGLRISYQVHDEVVLQIPAGREDATRATILEAMQRVNDQLQLNVKIGCSVQFGSCYADIH